MLNSIGFPKMFMKNSSRIIEDHEATVQNLNLLLQSEQGQLMDDPYFGIKLKAYLFDQNNSILEEILIDEIYTQIKIFMPQLQIDRKDISIVRDSKVKGKVYANIAAINKIDYQTDMYSIELFNTEQ